MSITMHGPAFDDSGTEVQREVPDVDVPAFEAAGYKKGPLPEVVSEAEPKETKPKPKK